MSRVKDKKLEFLRDIPLIITLMIQKYSERGCRLETITDQDQCKSDLEMFKKSFNADDFYFFAD